MDCGLSSIPSTTLIVSGDAIVGRALALLLRGPRYTAKFVPASHLSKLEELKDAQLLVIAPTPLMSVEYREAFLASLRDMLGAAEIHILELVTITTRAQEAEARDKKWHLAFWPCRIEDLQQRIEEILQAAAV